MEDKKVILVDNKQSIDLRYRLPRYALWHRYFLEAGLNSEIIVSNWSHSRKERLSCPEIKNAHYIRTVAYKRNKSLSRLLSEVFFAFQLVPYITKNRRSKVLYIFNDSGFIYLQIILPFLKIIGQEFCIDSNDLWPEIFGDNLITKHFTKRKFNLFKNAKFLYAVNETYFDYYKSLKLSGRVVHLTLPISEIDKIYSNYSAKSNKALYLGGLGVNYTPQSLSSFLVSEGVTEVHFYSKVDSVTRINIEIAMGSMELKFFSPDSLEKISRNGFVYKFGLSSYSKSSLVEFPTKFFDYGYMGLPILSNTYHEAVHNCDFFSLARQSECYIYRMLEKVDLGSEMKELNRLL